MGLLEITQPGVNKPFALAIDTLKKLPFYQHEINEKGAPTVPGNLNLDQRTERRNEVSQYFAHLYATKNSLRNKLNANTVENLNSMLKTLSPYSSEILVNKPFTCIYSLKEVKNALVLTLIFEEPLAALSLITAGECGFHSNDENVRKGALNFLIITGKCAEYSISGSNNIHQNTVENFSTLFMVRDMLHQLKYKHLDNEMFKTISQIDNKFEDLEKQQLERLAKLRTPQDENKEENKKEEEKVTIAGLDFLD